MEDLRHEIEKYDKAYYAGNPLIPDWQYDILKAKARAEGMITTLTSDTTEVQSKHAQQMYSLSDAFSIEEATSMLISHITNYYATPKVDGVGIEIKFSGGAIVDIVLRGDGVYGESVIRNLEYFKLPDIKHAGDFSLFGEAVFTYKDFDTLNDRRQKMKLKPYKLIRAAVAGTLKSKHKSNDGRQLTFVPYGTNLKLSVDKFYTFLNSLNFTLNILTFKELTSEALEKAEKYVKNLPYPVDGIVFKIKDILSYIKAGFTSDVPKGAFAYKFEELRKASKIINLDFSVGATGKVTPVIEVLPIAMEGSMVKRASIHNYKAYKNLNPGIGDEVFIVKKGEIIPQIVKITPIDTPRIPFPTNCPSCNSILEQENNDLFCYNSSCESKTLKLFMRFKDKLAFNINIGEATLQKLIDSGLTSRADIFKLTVAQLTNLDRLGEKSALKLKNSIENAKDIRLDKFIYSLSIKDIGYVQSRTIAKAVQNLETFVLTSAEQFLSIKGLGKKRSSNLEEYLESSEGINHIDALLTNGVTVHPMPKHTESIYENVVFVITGATEVPRDLISAEIMEQGGIVRSSVSKNTDYLIVGRNPSDLKINAAKKYNVKILTYEEFKNWALSQDENSST